MFKIISEETTKNKYYVEINEPLEIELIGFKIDLFEGSHPTTKDILTMDELNAWLEREDIRSHSQNGGIGYDKVFINVLINMGDKKYVIHGMRKDLGDGIKYGMDKLFISFRDVERAIEKLIVYISGHSNYNVEEITKRKKESER